MVHLSPRCTTVAVNHVLLLLNKHNTDSFSGLFFILLHKDAANNWAALAATSMSSGGSTLNLQDDALLLPQPCKECTPTAA